MRLAAYTGASVALATGVIIKALHERANFYSACVYLGQSTACLMILTNLILLALGGVLVGLQKLLYGPLRPIEIEQLYEKAWFAITETCLAMTIFREEVGGWFVVMFVSLLIGKVWGWVGEGRLEVLEQQPPANPRLFHARLSTSLLLSFLFDLYLMNYSIKTVRHQARPNMMVMFAFEFAVLTVTSISTFARYTISLHESAVVSRQIKARLEQRRHEIRQERAQAQAQGHSATETAVDQQSQATLNSQGSAGNEEELDESDIDIDVPGWEDKGRWVFYLDLVTDFFRLVLYVTFFCVLCMFYGMPIHIIRDVAMTISSFYKRLNDFAKYRHATRDMNERYPDATPSEIGSEDVCIICREGMRPWQPGETGQNPSIAALDERQRPKKLPCGHILHFACLRSWLERQQNCPTCRAPVLTTPAVGSQAVQPPRRAAAANNPVAAPGNLQAGQPPAVPQHRIRFFNLGPLRLGFGAGPDPAALERELNERAPLQQRQPQAGGLMQQIGWGLGFGRQPPPNELPVTAPFSQSTTTTQAQLQAIEQQLIRDVNTLSIQADQLSRIRTLQTELSRLHSMYSIANASGVAGNQARFTPPLPMTGMPSAQTVGEHGQQASQWIGNPDIPAGITIPDGWTLLPLHRLSTGTLSDLTHASNPSQSPAPASSNDGIITSVTNARTRTVTLPPLNGQGDTVPSEATTSNHINGDSPSNTVESAQDQSNILEARIPSGHPLNVESLPLESEAELVSEDPESPIILPDWGTSSSIQSDPAIGSSTGIASMNGGDDGEQTASSAERRSSKGKGRESTVEDAADEDV